MKRGDSLNREITFVVLTITEECLIKQKANADFTIVQVSLCISYKI